MQRSRFGVLDLWSVFTAECGGWGQASGRPSAGGGGASWDGESS